jgi:molecular chaperone IbpA
MTNSLFDRYLPSALGFDRVFDVLDHASDFVNSTNVAFPPVNIVKLDDVNYAVELAIAGYTEEEVSVETEKNLLKISGKKTEKDERAYIVKGIAGRSFFRQFVLADTMVVRDAALKNGILTVSLENVIPEAQKPRKIAVLSA